MKWTILEILLLPVAIGFMVLVGGIMRKIDKYDPDDWESEE